MSGVKVSNLNERLERNRKRKNHHSELREQQSDEKCPWEERPVGDNEVQKRQSVFPAGVLKIWRDTLRSMLA